jgi:hypothetical protein
MYFFFMGVAFAAGTLAILVPCVLLGAYVRALFGFPWGFLAVWLMALVIVLAIYAWVFRKS